MPRIPTFYPQGNAAVVNEPRVLNAPTNAGDEALAGGLTQFGTVASKISQNIRDQQAELDYIKAASMYDAGIATIREEIFRDPNVKDQPSEFVQRARDLQSQTKQTLNPLAQYAFDRHVDKTFPHAIVEVRSDYIKLQGQAVLADTMALGDQMSTLAAEARDPRDRDNAIATYQTALNRAADRGLINPVQHQQAMSRFQEKTLEKNMDYLRRTDRKKLWELDRQGEFAGIDPVVHEKILNSARIDQEHEEARATKNFKTVQDAVVHEAGSLALQGLLPQSTIDEAIQNKNPYITPEKARQLQEWNENPISGSSMPVRVIMQQYHGGEPSMERVLDARRQLTEYARTLDRPNKLLDAALNELQNDQRSAEGAARAERGVRVSEMQLGIAKAKDLYKENQGVWLPGMLGSMFKAASAADQAAINTYIRNGMKPEDAVKQVEKQRRNKVDQLPDKTKGVLDLAK